MPKHLFVLWIAALVYLISANALAAVRLEVLPAWNGHYKPGKPTELSLQLLSDHGGTFIVQAETLSMTVDLEPNVSRTLSMPLLPDRRKNTLVIRVFQQSDPNASATQNISFTASNGKIVALVSNGLSIEQRQSLALAVANHEKTELLAVDGASLPHSASGYAAIDLLVISYADLKTLQERQINALSSYLTLCGRLIAIQLPDAVYKQLQATAGCQGKFVGAALSLTDLPQTMSALLDRAPLPLPEAKTLSSFSRPASSFNPHSLLLIFCFGYLLLVLMAALVNQNKLFFMLLPILAAGVALSLWYRQAPESHLLSWLEMDNGQTSARYSASLTMNGAGIWEEAVTLPVESIFSTSTSTPQPNRGNELVLDAVNTHPDFSLLSSMEWHWQGHLSLKAPLELKTDGQKLVITNTGDQIAESGLLRWQGKIYSFPALASGETWSPDLNKPAEHTELAQLFARQSQHSATAVLLPYRAKILRFDTDQQGWLLIHYPETRP